MGSPAKPLATHDAPSNDAVRAPHDDPAQVVFAAVHEPTLTATEVTFLNSLTERVAVDERTRFDMAQMLGDDETLAALHTYRALFDTAGIDVDPALHTLPHALRLERLERRLALAQSLVHRHLVATMSPLASRSSDLHRLVVGPPRRQYPSRRLRHLRGTPGRDPRPRSPHAQVRARRHRPDHAVAPTSRATHDRRSRTPASGAVPIGCHVARDQRTRAIATSARARRGRAPRRRTAARAPRHPRRRAGP